MDNNKSWNEGNIVEILSRFWKWYLQLHWRKDYPRISKIWKLILVYSPKAVSHTPRRILHGFRKFCAKHKIRFRDPRRDFSMTSFLKKGWSFLSPLRNPDLVSLGIRSVTRSYFGLNRVISYNDKPLRSYLASPVISTDSKVMAFGKLLPVWS